MMKEYFSYVRSSTATSDGGSWRGDLVPCTKNLFSFLRNACIAYGSGINVKNDCVICKHAIELHLSKTTIYYRKILTNQYSIVLIKLVAIPIFFSKNKKTRPACMLHCYNSGGATIQRLLLSNEICIIILMLLK